MKTTALLTGSPRVLLAVLLFSCLLCPQAAEAETNRFSAERKDMEIPPAVWNKVLKDIGYEDKQLGFSADEMALYGRQPFLLKKVENSFRDALILPSYTGVISDELLAKADTFDAAILRGFALLDVSAGRGVMAPSESTWGMNWIPDSAGADEAFEAVLEYGREHGVANPVSSSDREEWNRLPEGAKRLVLRMLLTAIDVGPLIRESYDEEFLARSLGATDIGAVSRQRLYAFTSLPLRDTAATVPRASFEALDSMDFGYLALGSVYYFTLARNAIQEFKAWQDTTEFSLAGFSGCTFNTAAGLVRISGTGTDTISGDYSLVVDLGGDDLYTGTTGVPRSFTHPISVVIDVEGDDTYDSGDEPAGLACGNHGLGAAFDLSGDDAYRCDESGIGSACYGTGVVVDYEGDDSYTCGKYSQASSFAGMGVLFDLAGDDSYTCVSESQGFAGTKGFSLLYDASGDDHYKAKGRHDDPWGKTPVSLTLGIGIGRRADYSDGHSLAGGIGIVVDGAGDDVYDAYVFSLGSGYWWGLGMFEDCSGDDVYSARRYSMGGAAHFALGCMVDRSGNDRYATTEEPAVISLGHGRDGSISTFFDGDGDDCYSIGRQSCGASNLNSIGLFWDRRGDDTYEVPDSLPQATPMVFGSGLDDPGIRRSARNRVPDFGVFLDTQGNDTYDQVTKSVPHKARNNATWLHHPGPRVWGLGMDTNSFPATGPQED